MMWPLFCRCHMRQRGGDAVEHALDVDVDHSVPVLDLAALERRVRHQPGIVDDHVDPAVQPHRAVDQALDLLALGDVGLHDGVAAARQLLGQRLEPIDPPRAEHELRALRGEQPRRRLAEPAAGAGDDDDFAFDIVAHVFISCPDVGRSTSDHLPAGARDTAPLAP